MKRIIIVLLALVLVVPLVAQEEETEDEGFKPGYKGSVEFGAGIYPIYAWSINLDLIYGYQFNPYISAGIGTGWHYYDSDYPSWGGGHNEENGHLVPVFFDCTINMLNRRFSPYLSLRGGYSFYIKDDNSFFINPALGISMRITDKLAINVGADFEGHFDKWGTFGLNVGLVF